MKSWSDKQNNPTSQFQSFTKLLTNVNLSNLDETELRSLKQQHTYLQKLRQQRIKIQDIKKKCDHVQGLYENAVQQNQKLYAVIEQKSVIIEELQEKLDEQIGKMDGLQKIIRKQNQSDRNRNKNRTRQLQIENQQLRKALKHKQIMYMTLQQQFDDKIRSLKQAQSIEKRSIMAQCQQSIRQNKTKNSEGELADLKNLVSRQNKALKHQNQKQQQLMSKNQSMLEQIQWLQTELSRKIKDIQMYEGRIDELSQELGCMQQRYEQQHQNSKFKGQLDEIRKKVTEMTKGEIQKIQFIVNESD